MTKHIIKKKIKRIKIITNKNLIEVSGPLGVISYPIQSYSKDYSFFIKKKTLSFFLKKIKNLIISVTKGWFAELSLNGVGYKCFRDTSKTGITFDLGYSALINFFPSKKLKIKILKNKIILFSTEKEYLNNVISLLKGFSSKDSYKGKGILLKNEVIKLKKKK